MPKIVRFEELGGPDVLKVFEEPLVEPNAGEVRLQVQALGLNRADALYRSGRYLETPQFPSRLGYDAAGLVDAVGPGVSTVTVGDRVSTIPAFSYNAHGVYGESAVVPAFAVAPYPQSLTPEQGVAIWMPYLTAWAGLIERGGLEPGQVALITAPSSSVGLAAIQIAKAAGAMTLAATRKADKKARLEAAGADHVIVTEAEDLSRRVLDLTGGKGANVIFDPVAGPGVETLAQAAAAVGKLIIYGMLDSRPTPYPLFSALMKGLAIHAFVVFEYTARPETLDRAKHYILAGLESGAFKPTLDPKVFTLDQIGEAHRYLEGNEQVGKIVVKVS